MQGKMKAATLGALIVALAVRGQSRGPVAESSSEVQQSHIIALVNRAHASINCGDCTEDQVLQGGIWLDLHIFASSLEEDVARAAHVVVPASDVASPAYAGDPPIRKACFAHDEDSVCHYSVQIEGACDEHPGCEAETEASIKAAREAASVRSAAGLLKFASGINRVALDLDRGTLSVRDCAGELSEAVPIRPDVVRELKQIHALLL